MHGALPRLTIIPRTQCVCKVCRYVRRYECVISDPNQGQPTYSWAVNPSPSSRWEWQFVLEPPGTPGSIVQTHRATFWALVLVKWALWRWR